MPATIEEGMKAAAEANKRKPLKLVAGMPDAEPGRKAIIVPGPAGLTAPKPKRSARRYDFLNVTESGRLWCSVCAKTYRPPDGVARWDGPLVCPEGHDNDALNAEAANEQYNPPSE